MFSGFFILIILPIIFFNFLITGGEKIYQILKKSQPAVVKGIYWTAYTASQPSRRNELIKLVEATELNAVVIDLKDYSGRVFFDSGVKLAKEVGAEKILFKKEPRITPMASPADSTDDLSLDLKDLIENLKSRGIYAIARLVVFQDPYLAEKLPDVALKNKKGGLWRDFKGLAWVDAASPVVWQYNLDLAKAAIKFGFDEINFDYVRFPSDGNLGEVVYPVYNESVPKTEVMRQFFQYLDKQLRFEPAWISVDLFGMTLWRDDGLGIGQRFSDAAPYFDFIYPMVYPSHYPAGFEGIKNPAEQPYQIVYESLVQGKEMLADRNDMSNRTDRQRAKIRPWLQDFDLGADYTAEMIKKEKQATYDAGIESWLLWNSGNVYTGGALEEE